MPRSLILALTYLVLFSSVSSAQVVGDPLDQKVTAAFKARCAVCHDDRGVKAAQELGYILDLVRFSDPDAGYFDKDDPQQSYLREIIGTEAEPGSMPMRRWTGQEWNGPLTAEERADILSWIDRGGPSEEYRRQATELAQRERREDIPNVWIPERIAADLNTLRDEHLRNARYLTLTNLHNEDSVTNDELEFYRQATVKLLNSISRSSQVLGLDQSDAVNRLYAIDKERTIFRLDLRDLGWTEAEWERILTYYPYGLTHRNGATRSIETITSSRYPYMRADWFVFATSQPPLYHDLVGIPKQLHDLESRLGLDRLSQIRDRKVHRAGLPADSNVSRNNRLLERLSFPGGYYHISYDFARNDKRANFFENPLGPVGAFETEFAFQHDGGEIVYRLPNGFQAYVLVKADGERLSIAPSAIVDDDSMPGGTIINGISCLSCHYDGMKPENPEKIANLDRVLDLTNDNTRRFRPAERDLIKDLYPARDVFARLLAQDRASFRLSLAAAGITRTGAAEPVRALFDHFVANVSLESEAGEFGLPPEEFSKLLEREGETRELGRRFSYAGVQRQLEMAEYGRIAELTGLGEPRRYTELGVPYFGVDPETAPAPGPSTEPSTGPTLLVAPPPSQRTDHVDLLDADNLNGPLRVTVSSGDERNHFIEGEVIPIVLKANQDCFVTVLGIDHKGDVTLLAPNKFHPELKLRAGRSLHIPTPEMGFELFAEPPHGTTQVRVIATLRPLIIQGADRKSLTQSADSLVSLGNTQALRTKAIGVRQRTAQVAPPPTPVVSSRPLDPSDIELSRQYAPHEWATARFTFTTHPKP